jgi:hypothetical protein
MSENFGNFDWTTLYNRAKVVSFEPLPPAQYHFEVVESIVVTTSNGKPMIKVKLSVVDGDRAGTKVFDQFVLSVDSEKALSMFFMELKAFGLDERFFATIPGGQLGPVAQALFGKHVYGTVIITEWNGRKRNEVSSYSQYVGSPGASALMQSVAALASPPVSAPVQAPVRAPVQALIETSRPAQPPQDSVSDLTPDLPF